MVKFYAKAGRSYNIRVSNMGETCDAKIEIFDTNSTTTPLKTMKDKKNADEPKILKWDCPKAGTYYVKLTNLDPNSFGKRR